MPFGFMLRSLLPFRNSFLPILCGMLLMMVAIRFPHPEDRAEGFFLLARTSTVRTLPGEIYVCSERALEVLDSHKIAYTRLPAPVNQNEVDALRNTLTTAL